MWMLAMQGWGGHMGWGGGWMILFWLLVLLAIAGIAWTVAQRGGFGAGGAAGRDRSEEILRERYARGEIDEATYRRMRDELRR